MAVVELPKQISARWWHRELYREGTCTLQASVSEGTNHLATTGSEQSVIVRAGAGVFVSSCTYPNNPKKGPLEVTVSWENANPGVTLIEVNDGKIATKKLALKTTGSWRSKVKSGVPGYGLWGGSARRDDDTNLVPAGTPCTGVD